MKIKDLPDETDDDAEEDDIPDASLEDRKKDYGDYKYIQKQLAKIYDIVDASFDDKKAQTNLINECWDIYNCVLNENQGYSSPNSRCYVPIVNDAMNARQTRFINMLFPQNNRYADVSASDGHVPYDLIALLDYYVKVAKLRQNIMPGVIRAGDISGNYALYVEWGVRSRFITNKIKVPEKVSELGTAVEGSEEYDDIEHEEVKDERAVFSILDTRNLSVLPATVDDIEDAEIVTVLLRYTEAEIRQRIRDKIFEKQPAEQLIRNMSELKSYNRIDTGKKALEGAGVEVDSKGNKQALIYQIWTKLKIKGERRMMVTHMAGADLCLGCKRNPYWNDRVPVILQAVEKEGNSVWGKSQVDKVKAMQYGANDFVNMGFDSGQYSMLPIVMTDPEKNPNVGSMILSMASVWLTDPNSTKFAEFPPLWKEAFTVVGACKDQIMQSFGINPAMLPHSHGSKKPSQAEVAQEQQVALESTNDEVTILQTVLSSALEWMYDLDYQYRTEDITVKKFGQMGLQATMDQVKPFQTRERLTFQWWGLENFKAQQQVQAMISWGNVLQKMPPQVLNGRRVDLGPMLEYVTEVTCGPRIAPHTLIDQRHELSIDPHTEDELMESGFPVQTHPIDNDVEHLKTHMDSYKLMPSDYKKGHITMHIQQLKAKAEAQNPQQKALPAPSGPKPGAQAQAPTGPHKPPGAVPPDQLALAMPRKAM